MAWCQLQAKVCARSTGEPLSEACPEKVWLGELTIPFSCWIVFMLVLSSADFFSKLNSSKKSFRNIVRVSNSLDQGSVGSELGPNCLHMLSYDDKGHL